MPENRVYSVRVSDDLADALELRANKRSVSTSELIRDAIVAYISDTKREREIIYEIMKTRALVRRYLDEQIGQAKTDELMAGAERDVRAALDEEQA